MKRTDTRNIQLLHLGLIDLFCCPQNVAVKENPTLICQGMVQSVLVQCLSQLLFLFVLIEDGLGFCSHRFMP